MSQMRRQEVSFPLSFRLTFILHDCSEHDLHLHFIIHISCLVFIGGSIYNKQWFVKKYGSKDGKTCALTEFLPVATRRCVVATVFWWYAIGKRCMLIAKGGHGYDLWGKNTKAA